MALLDKLPECDRIPHLDCPVERKCTKETPDLWHVLWRFFFFSKELFPLVVEEVVEHGSVVKIIFNNTAFRLPIQFSIEEGQVDLVPLVVKASGREFYDV